METKQQKIKRLVSELLIELQGEPYWKAHWILHFLKKWLMENSTVNTGIKKIWNEENYSSEGFIFFSNSDNED
ncbi:hypothetical protein BOQ62_02655 [Chryseobacterium sp. CH21]|uniref:hypothetical protein n=1 Tax=Chryseobacterium sp. CH21 TaxID=713556 RepID=UPI00100C1370|nr:hypothetical protein [Chryseobacterium sp. CH21]RXM40962.1 hypothetical protein BOQ62_02655 [Chryseobacterium sp. CH21]